MLYALFTLNCTVQDRCYRSLRLLACCLWSNMADVSIYVCNDVTVKTLYCLMRLKHRYIIFSLNATVGEQLSVSTVRRHICAITEWIYSGV